MPHPYAYCSKCYTEHYTGGKKINTFEKCNSCGVFNGIKTYDNPPYVAFCAQCYKCHKSHNYVSTFSACTGCKVFNGLKWKAPDVKVFSSNCKKFGAFYQTHNHVSTFAKCLNCNQFNGLTFK